MSNGEEVLRFYYKPRTMRDAFREYESHAQPGYMSWSKFYRASNRYVALGRLRKTPDGYMLRYPIYEIMPILNVFRTVFWEKGMEAGKEEDENEFNPANWFIDYVVAENNRAEFTKRFIDNCDRIKFGHIVEFYHQMVESPNDALGRIKAGLELIDPTGTQRAQWIQIRKEQRERKA